MFTLPQTTLEADKPKFLVDIYGNRILTTNPRYPVRILTKKRFDDRKTRKRNIDPKRNANDDEIDAFVMEITDPSDEMITTESTVIPTTDESTEVTTTTTVADTMTTSTTATDTAETLFDSTTSEHAYTPPPELASVLATMPTIIGADDGFKPILDLYYGGTPNENANSIYLTTSKPFESITLPTNVNRPFHSSSNTNRFQPSVQYEYQNYRHRVDDHFIPIVGLKQIF